MTFAGFNNDHYVHVARAQQMLFGEWPVRDFVDPGLPLMYAVSAAAQYVFGRAIGVEVGLVAVMFALAAALTAVAGARLSGSLVWGALVALFGVLLNPRSFGYPKYALYAGAAVVMLALAASPTPRRIVFAAAVVAVAFLFRHDHGLFLGVACGLTLLLASWAAGGRVVRLRALVFIGSVGALLAPWALYVAAYGGHAEYWSSAIAFSRTEAVQSGLRELPQLQLADPVGSSNALAVLFYAFHALPVAAVGLLWQDRRTPERWTGERAVIPSLAVLAILANVTFMRGSLPGQLPDAWVANGLLLAWMAGRIAVQPRGPVRTLGTAAMWVVLAGLAAAIYRGAEVREQLVRARVPEGLSGVRARAADLWTRLTATTPEGDHVPSRYAGALLPFLAHVERCTHPRDRLLMTGLFPEVYVLAHRPFAGGHVAFTPAYYSTPRDEALTIARLAQQSVPFVIIVEALEPDLRLRMPAVFAYLDARYVEAGHIDVPETPGVRLLTDRSRAGHDASGWPCFT
jgi:hypothetical protein